MNTNNLHQKGFTLVELIIVIVIIGIISGMLAIFITNPVQSYTDSARRAGMTDMADTAIRRIGRDLRTAVPNSARMASPTSSTYVEFLPTRVGGMYQALPATSGTIQCGGTLATDILDFTIADSCFAIMGPAISMNAGDYIVLGSIQSSGTPAYDNTSAGVLRAYTSTTVTNGLNFTATQFPIWAQLASQRFQVVPGDQQAVTYACIGTQGTLDANGNGQAKLVRYWHYGFNPVQSNSIPPLATGLNAILVNNVSACNIVYSTSYQSNSLITITLQLTQRNESVQLYDEIHINNLP